VRISCGSWLGFRFFHYAGKSLSAPALHVDQLGNVDSPGIRLVPIFVLNSVPLSVMRSNWQPDGRFILPRRGFSR